MIPCSRAVTRLILSGIALLPIAPLLTRAAVWSPSFKTATNEIVRVLSSPNDDTCWFITNFDRIYKTSDAGQS
ncbi:MAG: hypothetical protein IT349_03550 [Candidatus Eisenbacteria bacterium]|nr:hypothetical protein [Candidatus Eisenbacteria bacterium]MCC7141156.1 hypothetical protein [Candidatus Eisenbacteria bacterium]